MSSTDDARMAYTSGIAQLLAILSDVNGFSINRIYYRNGFETYFGLAWNDHQSVQQQEGAPEGPIEGGPLNEKEISEYIK